MAEALGITLSGRSFTGRDQQDFARISGDFNPAHMDAMAARRLLSGDVIVHGVHTLLWSLEQLACSPYRPAGLAKIDVSFPKPLYLGEAVTLALAISPAGDIRLRASVRQKLVAIIRLTPSDALPIEVRNDAALSMSLEPRRLRLADMADLRGHVAYAAPLGDFVERFPNAAGLIGAARLRALAACSRLVGMECPGLWSLFSRLVVDCGEPRGGGSLAFAVSNVNPRYNMVCIDLSGDGIRGRLEALTLMPVEQADMSALSALVEPGEFAGRTALVIGGSRGLGELTAKLVAAGGGRAIITYASGQADAMRVRDDIRAVQGEAEIMPYDAVKPALSQLAALGGAVPSDIYYFATPQISRPKLETFEIDQLDKFMEFYVHGFRALCEGLWTRRDGNWSLFYPSSVFVEDRPADMTEYAMAKAAGEILCADLPRLMPGLRILVRRLPRLPTDQTNSPMPRQPVSVAETMLPIIREMRDGVVPRSTH